MRGAAMEMKRSKNSYMRAPRSVTMTPIGMPSRNLKAEMDFFERRTAGFWPVIFARPPLAASMTFLSATASPTPMLIVILVMRGTCMSEASPSSER